MRNVLPEFLEKKQRGKAGEKEAATKMDEWRGMDLFKGYMKMRFQSGIINGTTVNTLSIFSVRKIHRFYPFCTSQSSPSKLGSFLHKIILNENWIKLCPLVT